MSTEHFVARGSRSPAGKMFGANGCGPRPDPARIHDEPRTQGLTNRIGPGHVSGLRHIPKWRLEPVPLGESGGELQTAQQRAAG